MTDPWTVILVHFLTALPPTLVALAGLVTAIRGRRETKAVRVIVNGRLDAALARIAELEKS